MLKIAAALLLVTQLGNAAPAANSNLDASPPPSAPPAQLTQPGPPVDAQFQHGVVDPRGTDAQPLSVKVVAMPTMTPHIDDTGPHGPPPDDSELVWLAIVFGIVQTALMSAVVYFLMQSSTATRRLADAVERTVGRIPPAA
jgi:hypothetical protein